MDTTGIYEASGLALWLQTGAFDGAAAAKSTGPVRTFVPDIAWRELEALEASLFSPSALHKHSVTRGAKKQIRQRLLWPTVMICGLADAKAAAQNFFDQQLPLVHGHYLVWAWYVAMFKAIRNDEAWPSNYLH